MFHIPNEETVINTYLYIVYVINLQIYFNLNEEYVSHSIKRGELIYINIKLRIVTF